MTEIADLDIARLDVAGLEKLYEDLWCALGPKKTNGKAAARQAVARILRQAQAVRIRTIVDPLAAPGGGGGGEASKRFQLYEDGQTVADFILKHGDGAHLRLDVQRGNIRLVPATQAPRTVRSTKAPRPVRSAAPASRARTSAKTGAARRAARQKA